MTRDWRFEMDAIVYAGTLLAVTVGYLVTVAR